MLTSLTTSKMVVALFVFVNGHLVPVAGSPQFTSYESCNQQIVDMNEVGAIVCAPQDVDPSRIHIISDAWCRGATEENDPSCS